MTSVAVKAEEIATRLHKGQYRRDGKTPYIVHPMRVARRFAGGFDDSEVLQAVGWLHDVLEMCDTSHGQLLAELGSREIVDAVDALTRRKGETCLAYLMRLESNKSAKQVKVADMLDNLSDTPTLNQIISYASGLVYLLNKGVLKF